MKEYCKDILGKKCLINQNLPVDILGVDILGYISMSNYFPSFIVRWILNFVDQPTQENHENWYPTNKSDFTVIGIITLET
jgi:hypothetical protein